MQLKISKPALSRSLDRLVDLGLAVRGPDVRDRRSVLVHLTDEGMRYLSQLRKMLLEAAHPALPRKMARRAVGLHHPQMHAA